MFSLQKKHKKSTVFQPVSATFGNFKKIKITQQNYNGRK
jgi:hypothetical protein